MAKDQIRFSQLIGTFGPGAMLELPDRSVLVMGLDNWDQRNQRGGSFQVIDEPRLSRLLRLRLSDSRLATEGDPQLRTPPIDQRDVQTQSPQIAATVFPLWFVCDTEPGEPSYRRRLVRFQDLEAPKRTHYRGDDGKRRKVSPIRFVCGCVDGHLQDISWRNVVHQSRPNQGDCREPMWLEDGGTSGDPRQTRVTCDCGAALSLGDLFQPGRLGNCRGEWPWIGNDRDPNGCTERLKLLTRSATNTYFPQVARVISLPPSSSNLDDLINANWVILQECESPAELRSFRKANQQLAESLKGFADDEVFERIVRRRLAGAEAQQAENPLYEEFAQLASGKVLIGAAHPQSRLHAETLERRVWDPSGAPLLAGVATLVAVHRLREVACQYGFTRFEPAALESNDLEDVGLAVNGAPLARSPQWLPAIEQFGEGIFLTLDRAALTAWQGRPEVLQRATVLREAAEHWLTIKMSRNEVVSERTVRDRMRPEFVLAHSLAHALMTEIALDCGYPASSVRERIYVLTPAGASEPQVGILIYTASAGSQGTLGGLVEVTRRFERLLASALERHRLCSADPVCADHEPQTANDDRALHGSACHGCLVVSETSCEARNLFLDRAMLIDTVGPSGVGYFELG